MQRIHIISGRLVGPTQVELDEPAGEVTTSVQVLVKPLGGTREEGRQSFAEFLRGLPAGTRSREEIDEQIRAERDAWGDC